MLTFRECTVCRESHALRADGRMSIHETADGVRCEEPVQSAPRRSVERRRNEGQRHDVDEERQAAFDYGADRKKRRLPKPDRFDRTIYATGRPTIVRGGLPGTQR